MSKSSRIGSVKKVSKNESRAKKPLQKRVVPQNGNSTKKLERDSVHAGNTVELLESELAVLNELMDLYGESAKCDERVFEYCPMEIHRGVLFDGGEVTVFGNDGFSIGKRRHSRSQLEAILTAQSLSEIGFLPSWFGLSPGGGSWAIRVSDDRIVDENADELNDLINAIVWDAWFEACARANNGKNLNPEPKKMKKLINAWNRKHPLKK